MKKIASLFFLFIFSFYANASDTLKNFENKYKGCKALFGSFVQKTYISGDTSPQVFNGKITIVKPDKIKIEYISPIKQIVFVKGNKTIIYSPEEKQAVVSKLDNNFIVGQIFKNLAENKSLSSVFKNIKEEKEDNRTELILKTDSKQIKNIYITIDKNNNLLGVKIVDNNNNKVSISFSKFKCLDKKVDISLNLPKDTEIIQY